jgi:formamidopyrimidine-DNA glycosylase
MPELPEVETVRLGLSPHLRGRRILDARVRETRLRWPVAADLAARLRDRTIEELSRRGKYLLLRLDRGWLICHLGMSGSLRLVDADSSPEKHDHIDLLLEHGLALRYRDPRRFGAMLWSADALAHPLLAHLGIEPLGDDFDGARLHALCRDRAVSIKTLLMDAHVLVGVGNIYANESLFHAGIDPRLAAGRLTRPRCARLATAIRDTLTRAIAAGGSTLRDFVDGAGRPGYFQQTYFVYGRAGQLCLHCGTPIRHTTQNARSTFFCPRCQRR